MSDCVTLANRVSLEIGRRIHITLLSSRSVRCDVFCHLILSLVANRPQFMFCVFWKSRPLRLWRHCTIVLYIYCKEVSVVDMISYNNVAVIFQTWNQLVHLFALRDVYHWLMCTPVRFYYFNNTWTTLIVSNDSISIGKMERFWTENFPILALLCMQHAAQSIGVSKQTIKDLLWRVYLTIFCSLMHGRKSIWFPFVNAVLS